MRNLLQSSHWIAVNHCIIIEMWFLWMPNMKMFLISVWNILSIFWNLLLQCIFLYFLLINLNTFNCFSLKILNISLIGMMIDEFLIVRIFLILMIFVIFFNDNFPSIVLKMWISSIFVEWHRYNANDFSIKYNKFIIQVSIDQYHKQSDNEG